MKRTRGFTLIEMVTAAGVLILVASLVGPLYLMVGRAVETERARSELLAGAREVVHAVKQDVRAAAEMAAGGDRLRLVVGGRAVTYSEGATGVLRTSGGRGRVLGTPGMRVRFGALGSRGIQLTLDARRTVRSRELKLHRECVIARRAL